MALSTGSVSVVCAGIRQQPPGVITLKVTTPSIHIASVLKIKIKKCKRETNSFIPCFQLPFPRFPKDYRSFANITLILTVFFSQVGREHSAEHVFWSDGSGFVFNVE